MSPAPSSPAQKLRLDQAMVARGLAESHIHLRHLWPLPNNLGNLLSQFDKVLVPEMNTGQLKTVLRDRYLVPAEGLNRVTGKPFKISEVEDAINEMLGS